MNQWIGIGNVVKDAKLEAIGPNNFPVCKFVIAVERAYTKGKQKVDYIHIRLIGKKAELASGLVKGDKVKVEGELQISNWQVEDKSWRSFTEILADKFELISKKDDGGIDLDSLPI